MMKIACPHCSQTLELDPETLIALDGASHFDCPACGAAVAVPEVQAVRVPVKEAAPRQMRGATGQPDGVPADAPPVAKERTVGPILVGLGVLAAVAVVVLFFRGGSTTQLASATKDRPFTNTLGMKFVPVPGTKVLMCIHETRYMDYAGMPRD